MFESGSGAGVGIERRIVLPERPRIIVVAVDQQRRLVEGPGALEEVVDLVPGGHLVALANPAAVAEYLLSVA